LSSTEDFWKDRVLNPNALRQGEKDLWKQIEPILSDLLDELKANGKIEISFTSIEMKHLGSLTDSMSQTSMNYNSLINLFDHQEEFQRFRKATSEFGFDESKWVNLYVEVGALLCVLSTELFKALILFHLKDVDHHIGSFPNTMGEVAPTTWQRLKPYVDSPFRNSLAHGAWALENKKIVLFDDAKLVPYDKLDLDEFMIKIKKQNVLYICLTYMIANKKNEKFFT
jgi:hypothetical protein